MTVLRIALNAAGLLVVSVSGLAHASAAGPHADFCVAPNGNDRGPGTVAAPFATVERARHARARGTQAGRQGPTVPRAGARRRVSAYASLVFTPDDSGTADGPVTYAAWPGQTPVLSTGAAHHRVAARRGRAVDGGRARGQGGQVVLPASCLPTADA